MSNNITITVHEDGDCTHILRNLGSVDPFGSLVDAFCDAVKAAGYGTDSRFVALGYYWEALDEDVDGATEVVGEPWDGEYQVGDHVVVVDPEYSELKEGQRGFITNTQSCGLTCRFPGWTEGWADEDDAASDTWFLQASSVKFISRPAT